ncbi:MAG: hypothetical protein V4736_11550, partial [Bdellovibrionota bacterium]
MKAATTFSFVLKTLILAIAFVSSAEAYFVAQIGSSVKKKNRTTHIVVAGRGDSLGYMFQKTATTKLKKYRDLYPDHQFILLTVEEKNAEKDEQKLYDWGYSEVTRINGRLTANEFFRQAGYFKEIASIDFFTHNGAHVGINLDGSDTRLKSDNPKWLNLRNDFAPGGYVFLHGCNSGFYMAPQLSEVLSIPVAGSFTSTGFQYLHENHFFYRYDSDSPPLGNWAVTNPVSFALPLECVKDLGCLRMQADDFPYEGIWGAFTGGGLSFFKFFCRNTRQDDCLSGMANNIKNFISTKALAANGIPNFEDYKEVVIDYLCPLKLSTNIHEECRQALTTGTDHFYNSFQGSPLQCN